MRFFYATGSGGSEEYDERDYEYVDSPSNGNGEDKRGFFSKYKWWILAIVGILWLIGKSQDDNLPYPCSPTVAYRHAKEAITNRLKSPHSAVFPDVGMLDTNDEGNIRAHNRQVRVTRTGDTEECNWRVEGYVDAQNPFGAMIRNRYSVVIEYKESGVYTRDLKIY